MSKQSDNELFARIVQSHLGVTVDGWAGANTLKAWNAKYGKPAPILDGGVVRSYPEDVKQSPNVNPGRNERKGVCFHHAAGYYEGTISWCLNPSSKVSYHCLINLDGHRTQLAKDTDRAWHAGKGNFKGSSDPNSLLLGVSFIGDTNNGKYRGSAGRELTKDEIGSALEWLSERWEKYGWSLDWMTHHRIVSPGRKDDLAVDQWEKLYKAISSKFG